MKSIKAAENVNINDDAALTGALEAATAGGLRIFPVCGIDADGKSGCFKSKNDQGMCESPGKHPLLKGWQRKATTSEIEILRWRKQYPLCNFGVASGQGIFVVDVDPRHGGDETLRELEEKYGGLPDTVQVLSGGGGQHFYFRAPAGVKLPNDKNGQLLGPGIDIKGDGGFVVAPGSLHKSGGRYEWEVSSHPEDVPIAQAPEWILARLTGQTSDGIKCEAAKKRDRKDHPILKQMIPDGIRHRTLINEASYWRDRGILPDRAFAVLWAVNQQYCKPPVSWEELEKIVQDAYRYAKRPSRKLGPSPVAYRILEWLRIRCQGSYRSFKISEIASAIRASVRQVGHCLRQLEEFGKLKIAGGRGCVCSYLPVEPQDGSSAIDRKGLDLSFSSSCLLSEKGCLSADPPNGPENASPRTPLKREDLNTSYVLPMSAEPLLH